VIDLDSLAEKCASQLSQDTQTWKTFLWSKDFQEYSQSLSDGEIEKVLANCQSPKEVIGLLHYLRKHTSDREPFQAWLEQQAKTAGKDLRSWIHSLADGPT
jgi:hypothetical protein